MDTFSWSLIFIALFAVIVLWAYLFSRKRRWKITPTPDWESIARISGHLAKALYEEMQREYSFEQEANSPAMRAYEQARDEATK